MSERRIALFGAALCLVLMAGVTGRSALAHQGIAANGSLDLAGTADDASGHDDGKADDAAGEMNPSASPAAGEGMHASALDALIGGADRKSGSDHQLETDAAAAEVGSNAAVERQATVEAESKPLGRANGLLSVRPTAASDAANDAEAKSVLNQLDPRVNELTRTGGALAVVIGLVLLGRSVIRRGGMLMAGGTRPSGVLEILARYPIARGQQLILLKVARRVVLLHHSGSSMTALTAMTDPDEVAALLARMEAGSNERAAAKFRAALNEFQAQYDAMLSGKAAARVTSADAETEVIDLTRSPMRGIGRLFGRKVVR